MIKLCIRLYSIPKRSSFCLKVNPLVHFVFVLTFFSLSCEEVVEPDLVSVPPIQVIDGWLFPNATDSHITLSETAPFNSISSNPKTSGALVIITETGGLANLFQETSEGIYQPINQDFSISPFRRYTLEVNVNSIIYTASIVPQVTPAIDSLTFREAVNEPDLEDGFYVTFYFSEPSSSKNFYRWDVWQNGREISQQDINILSDENINGSYIDLELDYNFNESDQVVVRFHALTEDAFNYLESVRRLTESGSPAQAIPENPQSNISALNNEVNALGFFNAIIPVLDTITIAN